MAASSKSSSVQRHHVVKVPGSSRVWWWILAGGSLLLLLLILLAGDKSIFKVLALYREQDHMTVRLAEVKQENEKLKTQISRLKSDPKAVERIAREELGMVRPDEVVYRFVPPKEAERQKQH